MTAVLDPLPWCRHRAEGGCPREGVLVVWPLGYLGRERLMLFVLPSGPSSGLYFEDLLAPRHRDGI